MKKVILAGLVMMLAGCSSYSLKNEALTGNEYSNAATYCHADRQGSVVWQNNVAYCDNGARQYPIPKVDYKESSPALFH